MCGMFCSGSGAQVETDFVDEFCSDAPEFGDFGQIRGVRLNGTPRCHKREDRDADLDRIFEVLLGVGLLCVIVA